MKLRTILHSTFLTLALCLCACAPLPHTVAFDESAFSRYTRSGSGTLTGTAFRILPGKKQISAGHLDLINLMPVNAYTDEVAKKVFEGGRKMQSEPRFSKYIRETHPDDNGRFAFHNLPAGEYYVGCNITWTYSTSSADSDGYITSSDSSSDQWIYNRVTIKNGQTADIVDWNQGG